MSSALNNIASWTRAHLPACVIALVAIAGVFSAGALTLSIADHADDLQQTESEISELQRLNFGLREQAIAAFDHGRPGPGDLTVHGQIEANALHAARWIEENWSDPSVAGIVPPTVAVAALSREALVLGEGGGRAAAGRSLHLLRKRAEALGGRLVEAQRIVGNRITEQQDSARILTFAISAIVGLLLGGAILVLSILHSRRRRGLEERRAALRGERQLQALVRHGSDLITVISPAGVVLYEAGAVERVLGFDPAELEGEKLSRWLHPQDRPLLTSLLEVGEDEARARELRLRHRDGGYRTCEARATSLLGDDLWNGIVLNLWDVSERKQLEERLRHQAFHDGLTSLANRVLFNERLEHALVRAVRGAHVVSVLIVDLDDFKAVNDSLGHPVGDQLLREAAARLDQSMRGADTVARLGGDEFGVILDDCPTVAEAEAAGGRIIAALAETFHLAGRSISISASVGLSRALPGEATPAELIRDADLAMYAAKGDEKGTLASYEDCMWVGAESRLQLKSDLLEAAVDCAQFELAYQPIVRLDDGEVAGLEALLRWNHPTRGLVAPADFIPVAEETGAIVPIGRHVLRTACEDASEWRRRSGRDLFVSVNVSTRQLRGAALLGFVSEALRDSSLPAAKLGLEITETQLMRDVEQAVATLGAIRELGVRLAIDDFGTGYSSLSQLERLPVDALKIDREFTASREDGGTEHQQLLGAVVEIGASLGLNTVAEGIETPSQLERLRRTGYRFGQGYLFSQPVPTEDVEALLAAPLDRSATIG
jgi:diguanylate cyclase (GGDEF)-like protein/PAS domain S-box-containing protein